jgi:starch synthase
VNAAILFEPDGYLTTGPKLMGRQAAGDGFLRAAVKHHGGEALVAYTPRRRSAEAFRTRVAELDPAAQIRWVSGQRLQHLEDSGVLYRPDHALGISARARLRVGAGRYALCGVTHTLATSGAMDLLSDFATAPLMPWDALVCTSTAAVGVVEGVLDAQEAYLAWRFGTPVKATRPRLQLIPLGVHSNDFAATPDHRDAARAALGLAEDEVAVLFAGRLSINGKANPFPMYAALQRTAEATGAKIVLVHAGQFFNAAIAGAFRSGAARFAPDVRAVFLDGKDAALYGQSWRAADIFLSLSDSIQETFGITPVEAMAAGLPAVVTDWNGYKDTVRDGIDGFRIRTWQPGPGAGVAAARDYEIEASDYEVLLSRTSLAVAADLDELTARLSALVADPNLRRTMGEAGKARVRDRFDWSAVFPQYQSLWAEQDEMRRAAAAPRGAPSHAPNWPDPYAAFSHYPTAHVTAGTKVTLAEGASAESYLALTTHPFLMHWRLTPEVAAQVFAALAAGQTPVSALAEATGISSSTLTEVVARLAKIGLVRLEDQP